MFVNFSLLMLAKFVIILKEKSDCSGQFIYITLPILGEGGALKSVLM